MERLGGQLGDWINLPIIVTSYHNTILPLFCLGLHSLKDPTSPTSQPIVASVYRLSEKERIRRLPLYCEMFIGKCIESVIRPSGTTWTAIRKALPSQYKDRDLNQQIYSRRFLESYKDNVRSDSSVTHYCDQFACISENLVAKNSIDTFIQSRQVFTRPTSFNTS